MSKKNPSGHALAVAGACCFVCAGLLRVLPGNAFGMLSGLVALAGILTGAVGSWRLSGALKFNVIVRVCCCLLMIVPLINLITLIVLVSVAPKSKLEEM